jgi:ribonuclease Z
VAEFTGNRVDRICEFHAREAFRRRERSLSPLPPGTLLDEEEFRIDSVVLDHGTPCLAFAFQEQLRINVWREGLNLLQLPVGAWLNEAKRAVRRGAPDDSRIRVRNDLFVPLGVLKQHALRTARGHRIAYVVDAAFHKSNIAKIIELARGADQLFIETAFLEEDAELAAERRHLTAAQAGTLARSAGVSRLVPFHFSPRYIHRQDQLRREVEASPFWAISMICLASSARVEGAQASSASGLPEDLNLSKPCQTLSSEYELFQDQRLLSEVEQRLA